MLKKQLLLLVGLKPVRKQLEAEKAAPIST
jgi:hypothetical protein